VPETDAVPETIKGEIVISDLREVSHLTIHTPEGAQEGAGSIVTYYSDLIDATDAKIGTTVEGFGLVYHDPGDGRMMELISATDEFADGSIFWTGTVDINSIARGEAQVFRAFGVSGRYRGKSGTRSIVMIAREATTSVFSTSLSLCD
jgi:Allene oxide cyclase barrel like domain